jgi:hemerythrin
MLIHWKDEYLVGHPIIDYEHRTLVNITNTLYDAVQGSVDPDCVDRTVAHLLEYVERHFARDEALFLETDYPYADAHMRMHHEIEKTVRGIDTLQHTNPRALDVHEVVEFMRRWLLQHIAKADRSYAAYLA